MGLSGSGKSSLIKCINLLNIPSSGEILVDGDNILNYSKRELRTYRQRKISMVFQDFGLLSYRTVLENVELGMEICGFSKPERMDNALKIITLKPEGKGEMNATDWIRGARVKVGDCFK